MIKTARRISAPRCISTAKMEPCIRVSRQPPATYAYEIEDRLIKINARSRKRILAFDFGKHSDQIRTPPLGYEVWLSALHAINHWVQALPAGDPYGNRTHVFAVRGRRLSRLTKGPCHMTLILYHFHFHLSSLF